MESELGASTRMLSAQELEDRTITARDVPGYEISRLADADESGASQISTSQPELGYSSGVCRVPYQLTRHGQKVMAPSVSKDHDPRESDGRARPDEPETGGSRSRSPEGESGLTWADFPTDAADPQVRKFGWL